MKEQLPHCSAVIVFHFFYCRRKIKYFTFYQHKVHSLDLYMQETKTKACNYIPIYLFQSSTVSSQYNYPLCQTYILLLYCFHEMLPLLPLGFMQETYLFHLQVWLHLVFCSLNAQCFYACNTLCSYGYEVPVTTNEIT